MYTVYSMQMKHENLSHAVAREVRLRICSGELPPGERINEVRLARELAVSRTPLREALTRLAGEDFVEMTPRLGFSVPELTVQEVIELYPIRAMLDVTALHLAGLPSRAQLRDLDAINREIAVRVADTAGVIDLDDRFHMALLAHCPNRVLLGLIRQMMWRTRRYEHLYFSEPRHVADAVKTHRALLARLRDGDLEGGCTFLMKNMESASPALIAAIEARRR